MPHEPTNNQVIQMARVRSVNHPKRPVWLRILKRHIDARPASFRLSETDQVPVWRREGQKCPNCGAEMAAELMREKVGTRNGPQGWWKCKGTDGHSGWIFPVDVHWRSQPNE